MNRFRMPLRFALAGLLAAFSAGDLFAVRRTEDPLALVPANAATVAVIRWNELRNSPLGPRVFAAMDEVSTDGDAARFLRETGLTPREDIDTIVVAMSPGAGGGEPEDGLVVFEGRFDVAKLGAALASHDASRRTSDSGDAYYRLARHGGESEGAVALVNRGLIVAGSERSVLAALARKENGGAGGLTSGTGLGRNLGRVDSRASAWALIDMTRFPSMRNDDAGGADSSGEPSRAIVGAMKSVSLIALQATVRGDAIELAATGVTGDSENRDLLEDSLRGVLAMWRLAVQEKSPELVSVIRRFQIDNDGDAVSIRGTLPSSFLRSLGGNRQAENQTVR
jgi:hypothetical protein